MARNLFRPARQAIRDFKRADLADIRGDAGATQSQLDAIYRNLSTGASGVGAALTSSQQRALGALQRSVGRTSARSAAQLSKAEKGIVNRYGTAMGPAAQTALGPARAASAATGLIGEAGLKGARTLARGGREALAIQESAASEAQAGAQYAMAIALKSRYADNAAQVAQMQFELQAKKLDYRLAAQAAEQQAALEWKYREMEIDKMREAEAEDPAAYAGITQAASAAASSYLGLQGIFNTAVDGQYLGPADAAVEYMNKYGVDPNSDQANFIRAIAQAMYTAGAGPSTEGAMYGPGHDAAFRQEMVVDSIIEALLASYPSYRDQADSIRAYLMSTANAQYAATAVGLLAPGQDLSSYQSPYGAGNIPIEHVGPMQPSGAYAPSATSGLRFGNLSS